MKYSPELLNVVRGYQGQQAVHREGRKLARVILEQIDVDEDQVWITERQIPTRGFINDWPAAGAIGSTWEGLSVSTQRWSAIYCWTLFVGDEIVNAAVEFASTLPDDADFFAEIYLFIADYKPHEMR